MVETRNDNRILVVNMLESGHIEDGGGNGRMASGQVLRFML
jgi:hypothetical protein